MTCLMAPHQLLVLRPRENERVVLEDAPSIGDAEAPANRAAFLRRGATPGADVASQSRKVGDPALAEALASNEAPVRGPKVSQQAFSVCVLKLSTTRWMRLAFGYAFEIRRSARPKLRFLRRAVACVPRRPVLGSTMQKMFAVPRRTYS